MVFALLIEVFEPRIQRIGVEPNGASAPVIGAVVPREQHGLLVIDVLRLALADRPVIAEGADAEDELGAGNHLDRIDQHLGGPIERRDGPRRVFFAVLVIGHDNEQIARGCERRQPFGFELADLEVDRDRKMGGVQDLRQQGDERRQPGIVRRLQ